MPLLRTILITLALVCPVFAADQTVKVVSITDGDTVGVVDPQKNSFKVRLQGIDAPEKKQPFSTKSKEALADKVFEKEVTLVDHGKDRYGRTIAVLKIGDRDINRELVAEGWAWWYQKYAPNDSELKAAEASAREKKLGLWADAMPVAPWEFRKKPAAK